MRIAVIVLFLLSAGLAHAQVQLSGQAQPSRLEMTPFVGARFGGTFKDQASGRELELDDSVTGGILLNWRESSNTEWEIGWSHQSTNIDVAGEGSPDMSFGMDVDYLQVGGTYIGEGVTARPYMVATLGAAFLSPTADDFKSDTFFAFSIGGGWKLFPTRRFGLRLEGRFYGTVVDSDSKIFCTSGPQASGCLISTKGEIIWQWEMLLGGIVRF